MAEAETVLVPKESRWFLPLKRATQSLLNHHRQEEKSPFDPEKKFKAQKEKIQKLAPQLSYPFNDPDVLEVLTTLVCRIGRKIEEYDTILIDDASGRMVGLLLRDIASRKREEHGLGEVKTFCIAGGRSRNPKKNMNIETFIESRKNELGKVLLVTEYITTGESIGGLVDILERQGIDYGIAALSTRSLSSITSLNKPGRLGKFYYGELGSTGVEHFWGNPAQISGVVKSPDDSAPHAIRSRVWNGKNIKEARENNIAVIGEELAKLI